MARIVYGSQLLRGLGINENRACTISRPDSEAGSSRYDRLGFLAGRKFFTLKKLKALVGLAGGAGFRELHLR